LADFPVYFIKQLFTLFLVSLLNFIIKIRIVLLFTLRITKTLHIISQKCT